ncbi:hypothetical protein [Amantichitinum ursilacus]|uniref:Uncharacterized protein n=1 Tax=Amantichitinum ursilacus TaxID=857265 RepID=A0A0N0GPY8_9NEIS|nr:hypothetical protein [Amantichitinum ursilacus]KPC54145.1 hypothetical protein WG78_05830 [Amantichitinum ursilacus]
MPFDLDQIAPAQPVPPVKVAWAAWLLLLVLIVAAGAAALLFGARRFLPTTPVAFWLTVPGLPALGWLILLCFAIGRQQARQTAAQDINLQRAVETGHALKVASIPLAVLAAAYQLDALAVKISSASVAERITRRQPQLRHSADPQTVDARWLEAPGRAWLPDMLDEPRQQAVLAWALEALFKQIKPALAALPEGVALRVFLHVDTQVADEAVRALWQDAWAKYASHLPASAPVIARGLAALSTAEAWLERGDQPGQVPPTLLFALQLRPLLQALPPAGSAEAAVMLLLAGTDAVRRFGLQPSAALHRPERRAPDRIEHGLRHALRWSGLTGATIAHQWLTGGAESAAQQALLSVFEKHPVGVRQTPELRGQHDLDRAIGNTGVAGEWLAVALVAEHLKGTGVPQLVAPETDGQITLAVITLF